MSLTLKARRVGDVVILDFGGRLTLGHPTFLLRELLRDYLQNGDRKFVFNLGETSYMDSAGLGALIAGFTSAQSQGGKVILLNLTARVEGILQLTKLATVFDTFKDEAAALAYFQQDIPDKGSTRKTQAPS